MSSRSYVLLLSCPDRPGIVLAISAALVRHGGNIQDSAQFRDPTTGTFYMRVTFATPDDAVARSDAPPAACDTALRDDLQRVGASLGMAWALHDLARRARVVLMVSKFGHCLNDLLFRQQSGLLRIDVAAIISNHADFEPMARGYGVPFHHLPVTAASKPAQEQAVMEIVRSTGADLVVLARYMQVLSADLCGQLKGRAINIHHSFLPGFKGAKPYTQAYDRGVKVIGATAHYVTAELDEGPIIEQEVARVDHTRTPQALAEAGRDAECVALARAVQWHTEHRVIINGLKTVVLR